MVRNLKNARGWLLRLITTLALGSIVTAWPIASLSSESGDGFSFESIRRLIEHDGINSLEDLLPKLPEALRKNFVLVRSSRSSQGATASAPRAVLFGNN